jgi:hypothetical protein
MAVICQKPLHQRLLAEKSGSGIVDIKGLANFI